MTDHVTPDIGGTALGAMQQGNAVGNALEHQGGPQGRAQVAGILGRGEMFGSFGGFHRIGLL